MERIELNVQQREITGRKVKNLRKEGLIPAVVYGHGFESVNLQIPAKDFEKVYIRAGESTIVYIKVDNKEIPTIIHGVGLDPVSDVILHADFYKIKLDEKITADIPVVIVGEAPAVKDFGGILVKSFKELPVEAFPQDLPHEITVDVSVLKNIGDQILIKDLVISEKVTIKARQDDIIALVQEPAKEEEEVKAETTVEDVEVIKKEKPEEEPAEGEKAEEKEKAGK